MGGLWKMSTWDSSLRKLWSGPADLAVVSPDGSHIAFVKDGHEVWLVGSDGEDPHRILASDAALVRVAWSPTGKRLAYVWFRGTSAKVEVAMETCDLAGGTRYVVSSDPHLWGWAAGMAGAAWLPDGRIVYVIYSDDMESNLWAIRVDPTTGKPSGEPNRLAGWKDFEAELPQANADGKRLIAFRQRTEDMIYVGDLASGSRVFTPHRIVLDDWSSLVTGWTKDSRAILFFSKWRGRLAIFKQGLDTKTPETLISGPENYFRPRVSAGGTLLYTATASTRIWDPSDPTIRLMSTPLQGGPRSTLMMGSYEYKCGLSPSSSCVVSELKDTQLTFFYLDPLKGRGEEIASIGGYKGVWPRWDLSPDGSKIAIVDEGEQKGEIRILSLADRRISVLPVRNRKWLHLQHISWAADGQNLFALEFGSSVSLLLIDAIGTRKVLYEIPAGAGWISSIVPSPDGKHLAFSKRVYVGDVMLLENF
jgi:Tol biopolymer transport system component